MGESRVDMSRLRWTIVGEGEGKRERREGNEVLHPAGHRCKKGWALKMARLQRPEFLGERSSAAGLQSSV